MYYYHCTNYFVLLLLYELLCTTTIVRTIMYYYHCKNCYVLLNKAKTNALRGVDNANNTVFTSQSLILYNISE